jgi:hypothetical protein
MTASPLERNVLDASSAKQAFNTPFHHHQTSSLGSAQKHVILNNLTTETGRNKTCFLCIV